jgi:hypothetical protein
MASAVAMAGRLPSKLTVELDAGEYRLLVKRENGGSGTHVITDVFSTCACAGCKAPADPVPTCADGNLDCMIGNASTKKKTTGSGSGPLPLAPWASWSMVRA